MFGSRHKERKVTPPSPSYMDSKQFAAYLADLRNHRTNRPGGARPQPESLRRASPRLADGVRAPIAPPIISEAPSPAQSADGRTIDAAAPAALHPSSSASPSQRPPISPSAYTSTSAPQVPTANDLSKPKSMHETRASLSSPRPSLSASVSSRFSTISRGRDYYPDRSVKPLGPSVVVPTARYMERGQRWMEKEEAVSLRTAIEDMDLKDKILESKDAEEKRIYEAALSEAAELVWEHQNPGKRPQPGAAYRYTPHLRKNSYAHARTASAGMYGEDVAPTGLARGLPSRSVSGSSVSSDGRASTGRRPSFGSSYRGECMEVSRKTSGPKKSYGAVTGGLSASTSTSGGSHRRRSSLKRNISGEVEKPFSVDQIWEEVEGPSSADNSNLSRTAEASSQPLQSKPRNPLNRVQFAPLHSPAPPPAAAKSSWRTEIHRNPPSQSRNAGYTTNSSADSPAKMQQDVPRKHGVEVRSDDIRQATSMKLKDRSARLPTPSAVSDTPGRPIVSFDKNWKPPTEAGADEKPEAPDRGRDLHVVSPPFAITGRIDVPPEHHGHPPNQGQYQKPLQTQAQTPAGAACGNDPPPSPGPSALPIRSSRHFPPVVQINGWGSRPLPSISISDGTSGRKTQPPAPSISVSPDTFPPATPSIVLSVGQAETVPSVPIIVTPDTGSQPADGSTSSRRPLPTPQAGVPRVRQGPRPRSHWNPASDPSPVAAKSRATASCHECGRFIEGRFVALAGIPERFHPQCFTCYTCGTSLEALEIAPEPDSNRAARIDRIERRARGEILPEERGATMAEDGDARLRFYCHLDWHELFAPRCKHCKTPILDEHVVALGAHWHYGHFFCAECGDPFERGMTHIEKDGYAWCVSCQAKRTERRAPKCKRCKVAVIGQYVRALGGEWHDECFRCATCGGGFDDGQVFPREGPPGDAVVLCTGCRQRELKA